MNMVYNNKISEKIESNNRKRFYIDIIYESVRLLLKNNTFKYGKRINKKNKKLYFQYLMHIWPSRIIIDAFGEFRSNMHLEFY